MFLVVNGGCSFLQVSLGSSSCMTYAFILALQEIICIIKNYPSNTNNSIQIYCYLNNWRTWRCLNKSYNEGFRAQNTYFISFRQVWDILNRLDRDYIIQELFWKQPMIFCFRDIFRIQGVRCFIRTAVKNKSYNVCEKSLEIFLQWGYWCCEESQCNHRLHHHSRSSSSLPFLSIIAIMTNPYPVLTTDWTLC